jgi:hypothetical protein
MTRDSQFDLFGGRAERDAALARVSANAGNDWMAAAFACLLRLERDLDHTGESIRTQLMAMGCPPPHHHNAWGALIRCGITRGVLVDTGRYSQMESRRSHARRTPVYRRR